MTRFELQNAQSAMLHHPVPARTQSFNHALATQRAPWWASLLASITDMFSRFGTSARGVAPTSEQVGWTRTETPAVAIQAPRAIGATPIHYRAFSLLQPRITNDERSIGAHKAIVSFREHAKAIRQLNDQQVNDAACAVLDTFVELVDAFTPLWDAAGKAEELLVFEIGEGARVALHADILETVARLDAELSRVLSGETQSRERFDTVQRYVEIRYGDEPKDYGLSSL